MNLTQPTERFDTLAEAEDTLKHEGFKLAPDTCDWISDDGLIDAGVYAVEGTYGVSKFRIEYRTVKGKRGVTAGPSHTPVDVPSRRRFLTKAAGAVAGGAVLAMAAIPPAPAVAAPTGPLDPAKASPALRAAVIALDDAHERLKEANAAVSADDATVTRWRELNPKPTGRRAVKNWARRYRDYRDSITMDSWHASMDAEDAFRTAQGAVAKIDARDMGELALKACLSTVYDPVKLAGGRSAVIGFSVALNLISLTTAGAS
jgi:hypothetical protein